MLQLNLPPIHADVVDDGGVRRIWDRLRRKYVALTPEEWVRQHFVEFLIEHRHVPAGLMANEIGIKLNSTVKRCDTVVFNHRCEPVVIVEYKAPEVTVSQATFNQIVRYNMVLRARYLIVSNGLRHYCCEVDYAAHSVRFLEDIPDYEIISRSK